jgi:hypothetical protein
MKTTKTVKKIDAAKQAEFVLTYAHEMCQYSFTIADAIKLLNDCNGDSELAYFELAARGAGDEYAMQTYPELIFRYPSLYLMSPAEQAEYDRRMDVAMGIIQE